MIIHLQMPWKLVEGIEMPFRLKGKLEYMRERLCSKGVQVPGAMSDVLEVWEDGVVMPSLVTMKVMVHHEKWELTARAFEELMQEPDVEKFPWGRCY